MLDIVWVVQLLGLAVSVRILLSPVGEFFREWGPWGFRCFDVRVCPFVAGLFPWGTQQSLSFGIGDDHAGRAQQRD